MPNRRERERRARKIPPWYARRMLTASVPMEILLSVLLLYRNIWITVLIAALLFARNRFAGHPFGVLDGFLVFVLVMPFPFVLLTHLGTNLETLLAGFAVRGDWDRVLSCIPRYQRAVSRAVGQPRGALAAAGWTSKALLKTGHPDQAFAELESLEGQPDIPEADRLLAVMSLQNLAEHFDDARDTADRVLELDPDNLLAWGGVVELEALHLNNPEAARFALDQAKALPNIADIGPLLAYLEAITLTAESRHEESLEQHGAFRAWSGTMVTRMPLALATDAACALMQSRSLAALGRHAEAQQTLADMRTTLRRHGAKEIEQLCDRIIARQSEHAASANPAPAAPLPA